MNTSKPEVNKAGQQITIFCYYETEKTRKDLANVLPTKKSENKEANCKNAGSKERNHAGGQNTRN